MIDEYTTAAARTALRKHRGEVVTVMPLPDDYAYITVPKRAVFDLIAQAEAAGAVVYINVYAGTMFVSANGGYLDE